jgi:6-phosphogluconolactonase (cycloisomerase 2 family)
MTLIPIPSTTFTSLSGTSYSLGTPPSAVAATPNGTFLYLATTSGSILLYTIGTNGALTLANNGTAVATTLLPTWMTVDPSGNWLFVVSSSSNALLQFQINTTTGLLTQPGSSTGVGLHTGSPTQVYVTPNDQNVYVGLGTGGMDSFAFNSTTGALTNQLHLSPLGSAGQADNAIAADNNSAFLFVGESGSGIRVFTISSGGALKDISGSPFTTQLGPSSIVVDPTNTYVYVANKGANVISGYTLAASGSLTPLSNSPTISTGSAPVSMSLDSTGQYLLVINNGGSPDLQVFSFDATNAGALDLVTSGSTGTDPTGPISLSVVP